MALFFAMDCTSQRQTQLRGLPILNLPQKPECGSLIKYCREHETECR